MSYDFSNVTKIAVPEGEVYKITNSSNGVIWRKPYVWAQYTINTKTTYSVSWATNSSSETYTIVGMTLGLDAWSSYKVNTSGEFVGSGNKYSSDEITYAAQNGYSEYPYVTRYSNKSVIWNVFSSSTDRNMTKVTVYYYQGTITSKETEVRGTATGNIFLSNSPTAYPTNGVKNGYWYYRTQVGYAG